MSLSLICACGARIELDDAFAGQEIACPECQQPLKAPAGDAQRPPVRTSGFALASLVLAVVGAFTIVGTAAAVVLGFVAVVMILRDRERIAGLGFAISGIVVGVVFTVLTGFAFTKAEPFGFAGWVRERSMEDEVNTTGPLEVGGTNWAITRPDAKWGVAQGARVNDEIADLFLLKSSPDLLLVQIRNHAFIDVREDTSPNNIGVDQFLSQYLFEYQGQAQGFMGITDGVVRGRPVWTPAPSGFEGRQAVLDIHAASQSWTLVVRILRKKDTGKCYILRGYSPRGGFKQNGPDFEKAMDSFRIVK